MVAKAYSAARSALAHARGLGKKAEQVMGDAAATVQAEVHGVAAPIVENAKRTGRKIAGTVDGAVQPAKKRGRKPPRRR